MFEHAGKGHIDYYAAQKGQEKDGYIIKQSGFQSKEEFQTKVGHFIMMKDKLNKKT